VNFRLFIFCAFSVLGRAAHIAAHIAATLAKSAVGAGVLLRYFLLHIYILQSFARLLLQSKTEFS
jgi:hypothetical protein